MCHLAQGRCKQNWRFQKIGLQKELEKKVTKIKKNLPPFGLGLRWSPFVVPNESTTFVFHH
jgi:hypothetical protein